MNLQRQLRQANEVFARELGCPNNHDPLLAWRFSEDLFMLVNELDNKDQPAFDFVCGCGVNRAVHEPTCQTLSRAVYRLVRAKVAPLIERRWILCRWTPPPPVNGWVDLYGTLDNYPARGRYIPLAANGHTCTLPESSPPTPDASRLACAMLKEHDSKSLRAHMADAREVVDRRDTGKKDNYRDYFRDRMGLRGHIPGSRDHVSYPRIQPARG